ncbi:hypothetical protein FBUS_05998, partial [Fasciolopsis buskii]
LQPLTSYFVFNSRVSDESAEVTPIDTAESGQFSMSVGTEQSGHHHTEASGSGLTEVTRPGESQSILSDSSMFHMSIDLDPEASSPCNPQPVSADVSMEMSVSSDITPQKSGEVESVTQPPHSGSAMDMSIDRSELACQKLHPSSLSHTSELDNLDTPISWSLRSLISPSSEEKEEVYPADVAIIRLPSRRDYLSAKAQTEINCSRTDDVENKNIFEPMTQLSPASDKKTDLLEYSTEKKEIPREKPTVALQTPLPFESSKRIPQSSRRLLGSLPPLRSDRLAVQTSNQKVYRTLLGCQERSSRHQQLVNKLIISRIRDLEKELDEELCGLESILTTEKNGIKSVLDEISRTEVETKDTDLTQQGLSKGLSESILQIVRDRSLQPDLVPGAPGATELFIPSSDFVERVQVSGNKNIQDLSTEKASNKFSPADVICLSYDNHLYVIRTLFGLVHVVVTCRAVHAKTSGRGESPPFVIKPEHLIIHSVEVTLPLVDLSPVDCAAVHTLAEYVINLCNSREGRSQFCRLVGMTLEKAVWFIEYMMSPFFSLAGDLRAIFLSGHYVHLECSAPLETTFTTPGQPSVLHRSATSISVSVDTTESKTSGVFDRNNIDTLTLTGPITVTVKLCHRNTLTILTITIVYPSLELDGAQLPDTSVKVCLGHLR